MKSVALILLFIVFHACAGEQPFPKMDESAQEYVDRYGAWVESIPVEDRAWDEMQAIQSVLLEKLDGKRLVVGTKKDGYEESASFVEKNQDLIDDIVQCAQNPYLGMPVAEMWNPEPILGEPTSFDILLPHLQSLRTQSQMLLIQAIQCSNNGRVDQAISYLEDVQSFKEFVPLINCVIEELVKNSIDSMIDKAVLTGCLDVSSWSESQLEYLQGLYTHSDRSADEALSMERWQIKNMLNWIYEDAIEGRITALGVGRFFAVQELSATHVERPRKMDRVMKMMNQCGSYSDQIRMLDLFFDAHRLDFEMNPWERNVSHVRPVVREITSSEEKFAPVYEFLPIYSSFYKTQLHWWMLRCAASCVVELQLYQAKYGDYPESLDELDDDLQERWIDQMSGKRYGYRLIENHPVLYSFGHDRDDDQGRPISDHNGEVDVEWPEFLTIDEFKEALRDEPESIDGDWILYPLVAN
ncbi:MAG: hypothetical protein JJ974_06930 [Phycisphaerales bacterium]|nr:hypothetical protein [Phycisphaerales bacterium]